MVNDPRAFRATCVLVVEDELLIRMNAVDALDEAGFVVVEAAHAADALICLEQDTADIAVICTDVHMPGEMDGIALARHAHERWPRTSLLVMSGKARPAAGELPEGAEFLSKPYSSEALVTQVRRLAGL